MGIMSNENPTGGLPPQFMAKMQVHWSKVQQAFRSMDRDQTGQIDRKEFEELCDRFGCILTNKEMDQVMSIFDQNGDGTVDFNEFRTVVGKLLMPGSDDSLGVSLTLNPHFKAKKPEGRSKSFKGLNTVWNNKYFQALDATGSGKPLLQNILQGKYYMENTYTRPSSASNYKGICLDEQLGQPLVKSIVEGEFYFPKDNMLSKSRKVDYVAHNRKMTKEYSRLVAATRPSTAHGYTKGSDTRSPTPFGISHTRPARARIVKDIVTPRTKSELHDLWGRTLDDKFTEQTLSWLARASREEKMHFKNAIASHPGNTKGMPVNFNGSLYRRSMTPSNDLRRPPRPQSAPLSRPGTRDSRASSFRPQMTPHDEKERKEYRKATGYLDKHAIAEAVAFARSRPPSRGGSRQDSRPPSAVNDRPLSALRRDQKVRTMAGAPTASAHMIAGRKVDDVHPTIQQSTFGASWAAPCL